MTVIATLALPCLGAMPAAGFAGHLAEAINAYRLVNGLGPLVVAADLSAVAERHSGRMAALHRLSHEGFGARFLHADGRQCVENVATDFRDADALLAGWRDSPPHRRNLLDPALSRMGIGVRTGYVTFFACS